MSTETQYEQIDRHACEHLIEIARELYQLGLITSTGGNLSVRSRLHGAIWITPGHIHKGALRREELVCIDPEGNKLVGTTLQPSSEKLVHTEVYKTFPEIQAVIHAHAPYATTLVLTGLPFLPISTEAASIGEIPRIPFIIPGTQELARAVVEAITPSPNLPHQMGCMPAVLMQNHGIVVTAADLRTAADILEIVERTSQLIVTCHLVGIKPPVLPDDVVLNIRKAGRRIT